MPFVSITRLRLRSWLFFPAFMFAAVRSSRQAQSASGNLGVTFLRDARNVWWTSTAWDCEASMRQFMTARPHGPAMRNLMTWCDEASIVNWTQPDATLPTWPEAHRRMQLEGRPSKIKYPSPDHIAGVITPPTADKRADVAFK